MRLIWFILLFAVPVIAQDQCERIQTSLMDIEKNLLAKQIRGCDQLTPESIGMTTALSEEDVSFFNELKCRNLANLDLVLSDAESSLVVIDGLQDLQSQVVATQKDLAADPSWEKPEHESAQQFARDLALGSTIQQIIESPDLTKLFEGSTQSGQWDAKLRSFCSTELAKNPFCAMITTYGTGTSPALQMTELQAFLDEIRPMLVDGKIPDQQKKDMLAALQLSSNAKVTSFKDFQIRADENGLYDFISPGAPRTLNPQQVKFIRESRLDVPSVSSLASLGFLKRVDLNQNRLALKNAINAFKNKTDDATERTLARIRARWSSLYLHKSGSSSAPCLDKSSVSELYSCIKKDWELKPSSDNSQLLLYKSILASFKSIEETRNDVAGCLAKPAVQAWLQKPEATPDLCMLELGGRSAAEKTRAIILKLRDKLTAQEDRTLRFRRFAYEKAVECAEKNEGKKIFSSYTFDAVPYCGTTATEHALAPILQLTTNSLVLLDEGMRSPASLDKNRDCPPGQEDEFSVLCSIANGTLVTSSGDGNNETTPYEGSPQTQSTDAPTRRDDGLVKDALFGVANDIANTFIRNRMGSMMPTTYSRPLSSIQPMRYSQPIGAGMSDFVIQNAKMYGGYGRYYNCATCGFGSGPSVFNAQWGLGSIGGASSVGTLAGSTLSSRFFPAGTHNFGSI